jgi:hypothetical protein
MKDDLYLLVEDGWVACKTSLKKKRKTGKRNRQVAGLVTLSLKR